MLINGIFHFHYKSLFLYFLQSLEEIINVIVVKNMLKTLHDVKYTFSPISILIETLCNL